MLITRFYLAWQNKIRDNEQPDSTYDNVYMTEVKADGTKEEVKVDKAFLDLTDIENREFRYVL
jgi:MFS transporter, ACS family, allantoate permease